MTFGHKDVWLNGVYLHSKVSLFTPKRSVRRYVYCTRKLLHPATKLFENTLITVVLAEYMHSRPNDPANLLPQNGKLGRGESPPKMIQPIHVGEVPIHVG